MYLLLAELATLDSALAKFTTICFMNSESINVHIIM